MNSHQSMNVHLILFQISQHIQTVFWLQLLTNPKLDAEFVALVGHKNLHRAALFDLQGKIWYVSILTVFHKSSQNPRDSAKFVCPQALCRVCMGSYSVKSNVFLYLCKTISVKVGIHCTCSRVVFAGREHGVTLDASVYGPCSRAQVHSTHKHGPCWRADRVPGYGLYTDILKSLFFSTCRTTAVARVTNTAGEHGCPNDIRVARPWTRVRVRVRVRVNPV